MVEAYEKLDGAPVQFGGGIVGELTSLTNKLTTRIKKTPKNIRKKLNKSVKSLKKHLSKFGKFPGSKKKRVKKTRKTRKTRKARRTRRRGGNKRYKGGGGCWYTPKDPTTPSGYGDSKWIC